MVDGRSRRPWLPLLRFAGEAGGFKREREREYTSDGREVAGGGEAAGVGLRGKENQTVSVREEIDLYKA